MIFNIKPNKIDNNNNFTFNYLKSRVQKTHNGFILDINNITNNNITFNSNLADDSRIKLHNITNNIRITAVPFAIRNNKFDIYSFKFDENFPEVLNYDLCPEKLSTIFSAGQKNKHYSYGAILREKSKLSYVDGSSFSSCNLCDIFSPDVNFIEYQADTENPVYLKDINTQEEILYKNNYFIPKIFSIIIDNTNNLGLNSCYYFDIEQNTLINYEISEHYEVVTSRFNISTFPYIFGEFYVLLKNIDNDFIEIKSSIDLFFDVSSGLMQSLSCASTKLASTLCSSGEPDIPGRPKPPPIICPDTEIDFIKVMKSSDNESAYIIHIIPKNVSSNNCKRYLEINFLDKYQYSIYNNWQNLGEILDDINVEPKTTQLNVFTLTPIPSNMCYIQTRIYQECQ